MKKLQSLAVIAFDSMFMEVAMRYEKSSLSFSKSPRQILIKNDLVTSSISALNLSFNSGGLSAFERRSLKILIKNSKEY